MNSTHITSHFVWSELLVSSMFPELATKMELTEHDKWNYYHLIATVLEPERVASGHVTMIVQGKRSDELRDKLVEAGFDPSPTSQHHCRNPFDCAIDFHKVVRTRVGLACSLYKMDMEKSRVATHAAFEWIKQNCPYGFGQMYYRKPQDDNQIGLVHIGSVTPRHQGEVWEVG